jgi:prepilin-type N-terminal cleavage/methylation domain-containing protein
MKRTIRTSRSGFTLLEVLATLVFMGIILYPVMQGISLATAAAGEAKHKVEACSLAQTKLAEVMSDFQTLNQTGGSSGTFPDYPGYTWTSSIEMRDTNLSQVSVRVSWVARNQERYVDLASLVYTADTSTSGTGTSGTGTGGTTGGGSATGNRTSTR